MKQFLGYFGAFPANDQRMAGKLLQKGQSVIISPGGFSETLKSKDPSTDYSILHWMDLELPEQESAIIIPVSSIGPNDMFDHVYDLDLSPVLWLCGYKNMKQSIPILYPKSYERSYMLFGRQIDLDAESGSHDVLIKTSIQKGLNKVRSKRAQDPKRYLMTKLGVILKRGNQWILENVLHSEQLRNLTWTSSQKVLAVARNWLETAEL
jgi:hypothetical protein